MPVERSQLRSAYRLLAGAVAAAGVGLSFFHGPVSSIPELGGRLVRFLSFFTIVTHLAMVAGMLIPVLAPGSAAGRRLDLPEVRAALTGYLLVVGGVYQLLLTDLWNPEGWGFVAEQTLHGATQVLALVDWFAFVPRGRAPWRVTWTALGFPAVYLVWVGALGAATGWWPYPFLDVGNLGIVRAAASIAGLVALFVAVMALLVAVDRGLAPASRR